MLRRKRLGLFPLLTVFCSPYLAINTCVWQVFLSYPLGGLWVFQTVHCIALPPIVEQSRASGQQVR